MKIFTSLFILFLLLITSTFDIKAQTEEQKQWLREFSKEQEKQWQLKRAEAESLAVIYKVPIWKEFPDGSVIELQAFENGNFIYHATDNLGAAATTSASNVWNTGNAGYNLSGSGQILGLWEAGGIPRLTHQEYSGRITVLDGSTTVTQHAAHVAGTMIATGVSPSAKGMSYQGTINAYNSSNDLGELSTAAANGLKVSNHSYGALVGFRADYFSDGRWAWFGDINISPIEDWKFGFYNNTSRQWDEFLFNAPNVLVCKSAGNDRNDTGPAAGVQHWVVEGGQWVLSTAQRNPDGNFTGFETINDPRGIAKNTFTIGAVNKIPNGYTGPSSVVSSIFGNWGPTDDGRIKPDVVAAGVSLNSCNNTSNTAYVSLSGTSMATPNVSGSVGLLLEHQQNLYGSGNPFRSSTLKGLIIHTVDQAGQSLGPDYSFGWGLMNTWRAADVMRLDKESGANNLIRELTLSQNQTMEFQVTSNGNQPLKVTIAWIDPGGTPVAPALNPTDLMLVNDLDLRIIGPGGTHLPWILDPANPSTIASKGDNFRDNVEQVLIENPQAGTYTVRINHKGNLTGSQQHFSLIITGIALPLPSAVNLVSPINGFIQTGTTTTTNFKWNLSTLSHTFRLQIATDSLFNNLVADENNISGVEKSVSNLPGAVKLYWRVAAVNSGGTSAWSEVFNFTTTLPIPNSPVLFSPEPGSTFVGTEPLLIWLKEPNASTYDVQVGTSVTFSAASILQSDTSITDTSKQVATLEDGKRFYWRVRAKNSTGVGSYTTTSFITKLNTPTNFSAALVSQDTIKLNWNDNTVNETKYLILRKVDNGNFVLYDSTNANVTFYNDVSFAGAGTVAYKIYAANALTFSDTTAEVNVNITSVEDEFSIPKEFALLQNFPNPFNPSTVVSYQLAVDSKVNLKVYDVLGNEVATLVNENQSAGSYNIKFDGSKLSTGVYYYTLKAGDFVETKKMMLMK